MSHKNLGAAALITNGNGHVLLVKHSYGRFNWELPGGCAEDGESVIETAIREVLEETGRKVIAKKLVGIYFERTNDFHHFVFRCDALEVGEKFQHDAEITECAFWPIDALPRPISDFTIRRITDGLADGSLILPVQIEGRLWFE